MGGKEYVEVPVSNKVEIKVYRRRWVVLAVFFYFCMVNSFHWVQYAIVGDLVARYYDIPASRVDWTSYVFMGVLVFCMLPACFVIDYMGMRRSMMLGGFLMMASGWCKVIAVSPDRFPVVLLAQILGMRCSMMLGGFLMMASGWCKGIAVSPDRFPVVLLAQILVGLAQLFSLGTPPKVAATWFHADELSTACAIAVFGNQLGIGVGFLVPPMLVRSREDALEIGRDLRVLTYITAANSTLVAVLVLLFKKMPKLPPNPMQALERANPTKVTLRQFLEGLCRLMANRNYVLMCASNGIANGALNVFVTVLNPVILSHFPDGQKFAGRIGLVIILVGLLGCVVFGVLLDKTHKYKEFTVGVYAMMAATTVAFGFVLKTENPTYVYFAAGILGLFLVGFMPVAFEMSAEVTFPESESTMGSLLFIPSNILGILMAMAFSELLRRWGDLHGLMFVGASLLLGSVLAARIQRDYRRLAANTGAVPAALDHKATA